MRACFWEVVGAGGARRPHDRIAALRAAAAMPSVAALALGGQVGWPLAPAPLQELAEHLTALSPAYHTAWAADAAALTGLRTLRAPGYRYFDDGEYLSPACLCALCGPESVLRLDEDLSDFSLEHALSRFRL